MNTVGFYNRKFFVLFLMYTMLACSWVILTSLPKLLALREPGAMRSLERQMGATKCARAALDGPLGPALGSHVAVRACVGLAQSWFARWRPSWTWT